MKPYIGILIDSFWEAVGNRVLWVLLIGWTFVLLALAPFGYVSNSSFKLSSADIDDRAELIEKLAKGVDGKGNAAVLAVASRLDEEFADRLRKSIDKDAKNKKRIRSSELAKALNKPLLSKDLYSEDVFPTAKRRKRLEPLIEAAASLNESELEQLNRELIQLTFPLELNRPRGEQLWFGYAGFKIRAEPLRMGRRQANKIVEPILQGIIVSFGLGFVVVFVSLIVTSSIIPDTFRSSSLHLLLSKPISRVWLFLSKFFGSCFFVALNLALVILGLYLIAGFRLGIWNEGLFLCIPILLFVFVIFYAVSAFIGLIWGNAIVCVISCILFWLGCFLIGAVQQNTKLFAEVYPQIRRIVPAEKELLAVNGMGKLLAWNQKFSVWQPAIAAERFGQARTFGPVYVAETGQLIAWSFAQQGPFGMGTPSRKIQIANLENVRPADEFENAPAAASQDDDGQTANVDTPGEPLDEATSGDEAQESGAESGGGELKNADEAREAARWSYDPGPAIPAQVSAIVQVDGRVIAVCRAGLYALDLEKLGLIEQTEKALFGFRLPFAKSTAFEKISPPEFSLSDNVASTTVVGESGLVTYHSGVIDRLVFADGKFSVVANTKLSGDGTEEAVLGANQDYVVVAREELPLTILDRQLQVVSEDLQLPREARVKQIAGIPDTNRMAIVSRSGDFLELDCDSGSISTIQHPFGRNCTAMHWLDEEHVWLGVSPNRVILFNVSSGEIEQECSPAKTGFERFYAWLIKPAYQALPKPSSLGQTMQYVLSGEETMRINNQADSAQLELDIWEPIFSNLAFVAVMLILCCVYIARKEF